MVAFQHRLPWESDNGARESSGLAPGKQTLSSRVAPRIGEPFDPLAAAAPGLGAIAGSGAKPARPPDDAFALHLETAKPAPAAGETPAASTDPAAEAAQQAQAMRVLLRADASFLAAYAEALDVGEGLKIAPSAAALVLSRFEVWSKLGKLSDLVAQVRQKSVSGVLPALLGTDDAWTYLVAVLDKPARRSLYDLLADGNADARKTTLFTEDIVEFWSVQMGQDAAIVKSAYRELVSDDAGPGNIAVARMRIITTLAEYRALDTRYGMKGTLLDRFLKKVDVTVTLPGGLFGIGEQQTRMLDDIKRHMGPSLGLYMGQLAASNMPLAKGDAPELVSLGGSVAQDLQETVLELAAVGDVIAFLDSASKEVRQDCLRWLARTPSKLPLLLDFIAGQFEDMTALCAFGLSLLSAETIVEMLQSIDVARIGRLYGALVTCTAGVIFLPQLFAAYWLLPDKTRDKVFSTLGKTAFEPIISEAKAFIVPVLQDLVDRHLPVGTGVYFERGLTASVAYAVAGGDSSFSITRTGPGLLRYDERFTLRGGVEYSRGVGKTEGKKADDGEKQRFWAHEAALTLGGKMELTTQNRYEFPFLDDDAFVGLLAAFVDIEAAVSAGALIFDELDKIDPFPFLLSSKLEPKLTGEAQGVAQSGMREGKGGEDKSHEWEGGQKPEEMGSSVGGPFGAQASARISQLVEAGGSLEIERDQESTPDRSVHEVSVQVGVRAAVGASTNIPGLSALVASVPPADTGVSVKATWTIAGLVQDAPTQVGSVQLSLVGTTGDMDSGGSASETEVELPDGVDLDSADAFIAKLGGATFKRKIGIASGLGRKMLSTIDNQRNLSAQLKAEYEHVGIKLTGSISIEVELEAAATREIARIFLELLRSASDVSFDDVRDAVMTFLTTGRLPDSIETSAARIGELLEAGLVDVGYRIDAGLAGSAGHVVGGVGGHGYAGAGLIFEGDVPEALDALGSSELLAAVRGTIADAGETVLDDFLR